VGWKGLERGLNGAEIGWKHSMFENRNEAAVVFVFGCSPHLPSTYAWEKMKPWSKVHGSSYRSIPNKKNDGFDLSSVSNKQFAEPLSLKTIIKIPMCMAHSNATLECHGACQINHHET